MLTLIDLDILTVVLGSFPSAHDFILKAMINIHKNNRLITLLCYVLVLAASLVSLAAALYMQHVQGLQPCTLCIIQRYAFVWVGLCAAIALIFPINGVRLAASLFGVVGAIGGVVAAARNLWVLYHPDILCGRDPVEMFLNGLPTAQWFPKVFAAFGLCSDPIPPLLGLPLPTWSLFGLLALSVLLILAVRRR